MKPSNFPERKNQRRKAALTKLKDHEGVPAGVIERAILNARIKSNERHVRSKISRAPKLF